MLTKHIAPSGTTISMLALRALTLPLVSSKCFPRNQNGTTDA